LKFLNGTVKHAQKPGPDAGARFRGMIPAAIAVIGLTVAGPAAGQWRHFRAHAVVHEKMGRADAGVSLEMMSAVIQAERETGVPADLLLAIGSAESGLKLNAKNPLSTAKGPFQFTEGGWISTFMEFGPRHGYGSLADLSGHSSGHWHRRVIRQVLALRTRPGLAALMTAEEIVKGTGTAHPGTAQAYLVHVMGKRGEERLVSALTVSGRRQVAAVAPVAAKMNRGLFSPGHRQLSVVQAMNHISAEMNAKRALFRNMIASRTAPVEIAMAPDRKPRGR
jgi:hypothetical protein